MSSRNIWFIPPNDDRSASRKSIIDRLFDSPSVRFCSKVDDNCVSQLLKFRLKLKTVYSMVKGSARDKVGRVFAKSFFHFESFIFR